MHSWSWWTVDCPVLFLLTDFIRFSANMFSSISVLLVSVPCMVIGLQCYCSGVGQGCTGGACSIEQAVCNATEKPACMKIAHSGGDGSGAEKSCTCSDAGKVYYIRSHDLKLYANSISVSLRSLGKSSGDKIENVETFSFRIFLFLHFWFCYGTKIWSIHMNVLVAQPLPDQIKWRELKLKQSRLTNGTFS